MKKYTKDDLKSFEIVDEYLICPTGDYSEINSFNMMCSFGAFSKFGEQSSFGKHCTFEESCNFEDDCDFGEVCVFEKYCEFGNVCSFGERCEFRNGCRLGEKISFGDKCNFGEHCKIENNLFLIKFLKFDRLGNHKECTYFFLDSNKNIFVRCGNFFGSIEEFREYIKETYYFHIYYSTTYFYFQVANLANLQLLN